jgi:hypothetical protein
MARKTPDIEPPYEGEYLWNWYVELASARGGSGFGPNPIGFCDIEAWARLTGRRPIPWEVETLRRMDDATLLAVAKKSDGGEARQIAPDDWQALDRALDRMG